MNVRSLEDYRPSLTREISGEDIVRMLDEIEESSEYVLSPPPYGPWTVQP